MDKLKPCPFCGYNMATEEDVAYQKAGFVGPRTPVWEVCCGSTGCNASVSTTSRESAVTAWNTRATSGVDSASLEQRARELLARELDAIRFPAMAAEIRDESGYNTCGAAMVRAVTAALANQQGVEKDAARYRWLRDSRACSLEVSFNDHHNMYMSVSDTLENSQEYYDNIISAAEREKMVATDTIWTVHIYPNTPVGFNVYHAATLDAAIDAAMSTQPAGDVGRDG